MITRKSVQTEKREDGALWAEDSAEELYCFHNFPVHMGVSDRTEATDFYADMQFMIDKRTGMIFLDKLVPETVLYQNAHYNNVGKGWVEHHKAFADFIMKRDFSNIFEIGGGTGLLSQICNGLGYKGEWTILDPVPNPAEGCQAHYVKGFFDKNFRIPEGMDAVVHTHTLEHFYDPQGALDTIGQAMPIGSWMFMSVPNMVEMYRRLFTNVLNFEHTFYCAEPYISYMLAESGYEVMERQTFKDDHSVFYAVQKTDARKEQAAFIGFYEENKKLFTEWLNFHIALVEKLNKQLAHLEDGQTVYLFGAHVYSQFLLGFGLILENIRGGGTRQ